MRKVPEQLILLILKRELLVETSTAQDGMERWFESSVVSVAITVNIVRGIGLHIGTLRAQYRRTLILSYWGSNRTTGIGTKVF